MSSYEIRLSKPQSSTPTIMRVRRVSDFAAIRNARAIARDGDTVEVWKGADCIYADTLLPTTMLHKMPLRTPMTNGKLA